MSGAVPVPTRPFGPAGVPVAAIGLGTWQMERDPPAAVLSTIARALDLGLNHIDTAEMYGSGAVEELVGRALAGRRGRAFLASKVLPSNASRRGTIAACEASLRRLGTDWLDLYLLHWPGSHPLEDTVAAFAELERAGKIRHWGVSNFDTGDLDALAATAGGSGSACNQVLYHLGERAIEHAVLPRTVASAAALVAYSPLGQGDYPAPASRGGRALAAVAERHGFTPRQVMLAFLLRHPSVFVIPKTSRVEHLEENAGAAGLRLDAGDLAALEAAFPVGPPRALPTA